MKCFGCGESAVITTELKNGKRHHCTVCGRAWTTKAEASAPLADGESPRWWHS